MKILLLSRYSRLGASSRIRSYQYLPFLRQNGIQVTAAPFFDTNYLIDLYASRPRNLANILRSYIRRLVFLLKSNQFDMLMVEYEVLPWLPAFGEAMLTGLEIPYIVDFDDAVFHRYDMHSSDIVRTLLGQKIDKVMRRASLVIVGNEYLENRAKRVGAKWVEILPSVIDLERYRLKPYREKSVFTIGWIGSPTTARYLHIVETAIADLCRQGKTQLVLVGSGHVHLNSIPVVIRNWSEKSEVDDIRDFDVGIMPMPDDSWTRGKCGYKLIQYMACGRPVVASRVGVNPDIVEDGINGFLAENTADWIHAFETLHNNFSLRARMGKSGRRKVEAEYCMQITAPRLLSYIHRVFPE
jgi:glycosyltransferase involved in cell wall biosynthesis